MALVFTGGLTGCTLDAKLSDFDLRVDLPSTPAPVIEPKTSEFGVNGVQSINFSIDKANMNVVAMSQDSLGRLYAFQSPSSQVYYWIGKAMVYRMNADGSLDTSFGVDGYALLPDQCTITHVQITETHIYTGCGESFGGLFVTRLFLDGRVDTRYGTNGVFSIPTDHYTFLKKMVVDNHGRILLAAGVYSTSVSKYQWVLARVTTAGVTDPTFDTDGIVTRTFSHNSTPLDMIVTADDSIFVFGVTDGTDKMIAAKFANDGAPDTATFASGTGGVLTLITGTANDDVTARAHLLDNGKFLLAGTWIRNFASDEGYAISLNTDGTFDTSFDGDGVKYFTSESKDIKLTHDIILGPNSFRVYGTESCGYECLNRISFEFDSSGNLNPSWGVAGKLLIPMVFSYLERTFLIQNSFYSVRQEPVGDPAFEVSSIEALGADLSPRTSFGDNGKVAIMLGTTDIWSIDGSLKLSNGSYLQWGRYQGLTGYSMMWKLDQNGKSDTSFGTNGISDNILKGLAGSVMRTMELSNGDLRMCSQTDMGHLTIAALTKEGQHDLSFGSNGFSHYDVNLQGFWSQLMDCFIDHDDKITAVFIDGDVGYILLKLNPDGSRVTSFGSNGEAPAPFPATPYEPRMNYRLKNGGFILAGAIYESSQSLGMTQVHADGTLNTAFGVNGTVSLSIDPATDHDIMGFAEDSEGILYALLGLYDSDWNADAGIFSFSLDGSLNTNFSEDGWVRTGTSFWLNTTGPGANMLLLSPSQQLVVWGNDIDDNSLMIAYDKQGTASTDWANGTAHIPVDFAQYKRVDNYEVYNWFFEEDGSIKVFDNSGMKRLWPDGTVH